MHALPVLSSKTAKDLLDAMHRLTRNTQESWSVDWGQYALVCSHKVLVSPSVALNKSPDFLVGHAVGLHGAAQGWAVKAVNYHKTLTKVVN